MKVREYRRIVEAILCHLDEGIHVIGADERTIIYNEAMSKLEKMKPGDVLKRPFRSVFRNIDEKDSTLLLALKSGIETESKQQIYRNKDGNEIATVNSTYPVMDGERIIGAIEIARNITDLQKMSETIIRLRNETVDPLPGRTHDPGRSIRRYQFDDLIGKNKEFLGVVGRAKKSANSDVSVLIYGETGTGKELFAQSIHFCSHRKDMPFLAQNCAALPASLLEGILFGTAKGGFTGAVDRAGLFEQANGGTLLLDEISAMPYELQGKLLRVLQEKYIRRIGGAKDIPINVRILATINEPAAELIALGKLRKDLYYRLGSIFLDLPPLRKRRDDILLLAETFLAKHNRQSGKEVWMLSEGAKQKLLDYDYPGNIRELENIVMAGISMTENEHVLTEDHIEIKPCTEDSYGSFQKAGEMGLMRYLALVEEELIRRAVDENRGNISRAAAQLKIKRQSLQYKLRMMNERDGTKE